MLIFSCLLFPETLLEANVSKDGIVQEPFVSLFEFSSMWDLGEVFREGHMVSLFLPYFRAKLASTIAENQEKDLEKTRQYSQELRVLTEQLQSLTFFLHTKLKETVGSGGSFSSLPIMSLNKDGFISSFPICISLVSFSCLTAVVRTFFTMLKRRERGQPCFVPNLKG